jgi:hypothetical protein
LCSKNLFDHFKPISNHQQNERTFFAFAAILWHQYRFSCIEQCLPHSQTPDAQQPGSGQFGIHELLGLPQRSMADSFVAEQLVQRKENVVV